MAEAYRPQPNVKKLQDAASDALRPPQVPFYKGDEITLRSRVTNPPLDGLLGCAGERCGGGVRQCLQCVAHCIAIWDLQSDRKNTRSGMGTRKMVLVK